MTFGLIVLAVAVLIAAASVVWAVLRTGEGGGRRRIEQLVASQQALAGQLTSLTDQQAATSAATAKAVQESSERLTKAMNERLEKVQHRMEESLQKSSKETAESVASMTERLTVIDKAQEIITKLSTEVVGLQHILDDKQARGAFGEVQLDPAHLNLVELDDGRWSMEYRAPRVLTQIPNGRNATALHEFCRCNALARDLSPSHRSAGHGSAKASTSHKRRVGEQNA